jgi:hypothetical protein
MIMTKTVRNLALAASACALTVPIVTAYKYDLQVTATPSSLSLAFSGGLLAFSYDPLLVERVTYHLVAFNYMNGNFAAAAAATPLPLFAALGCTWPVRPAQETEDASRRCLKQTNLFGELTHPALSGPSSSAQTD